MMTSAPRAALSAAANPVVFVLLIAVPSEYVTEVNCASAAASGLTRYGAIPTHSQGITNTNGTMHSVLWIP